MQNTSPDFTSFNASILPASLPIGVMVFAKTASLRKKQMLPVEGKNATSPFLNSERDLSMPESTPVSKYRMLFPKRWAWPSKGRDLIIVPTVRGDK